MTIAATEAATPVASTRAVPVDSRRHTPASPTPAPARAATRGRSASSSQATSIIATGEVAMTVDATPVGRRCAAT